MGAKVVTDCRVTGIQVAEDDFGRRRVVGVETDRGTVRTKALANCTGVWAPAVGAMAGVHVPLVAMRHAYVVTEKIEGVQNLPNVRDHDASMYLRLQGDALSVGGYEPDPIFTGEVPSSFSFSLYELDWDVFSITVQGAINRVPAIEHTGIKSTVCGPESFTPDHKPIMGEATELRGFYHGAGFNSSGMMLGGGCGRELARWIVNGRPALDMFGFDIRRFPSCLVGNTAWIKERSHESYAKNYAIVYPHDEPLAYRNARKDPFHQVLLDAGCVYQERHGWERPGWFRDDGVSAPPLEYDYYGSYGVAEHQNYQYYDSLRFDYTFDFPHNHHLIGREALACRQNAALFNMSYFGKYYLTGPDARQAADWLFTADVTAKPHGGTTYTCMLNQLGGTEADLTVSVVTPGDGQPHQPAFTGDGYYLAVGGAAAQQNLNHIRAVIDDQRWNCTIIDHTDDMGLLSLQGPNSRALLQKLTDADLSDEAFPFSSHRVISVAGHNCRALRLSFVGELGWELHVPSQACVPVYKALMEAGAPLGLVNAGYRAIDSLSSEKGYRHWHSDLRPDDSPLEAGLAFTCKLKTAIPFLGRDVMERQKRDGLAKKLAMFTIDAPVPLHGLESVWRDGEAVGFLRRGEFAFALGKSIGYGYVRAPQGGVVNNTYLRAGSYQLERMGERYDATLHVQSPFDPKNMRVKGVYT